MHPRSPAKTSRGSALITSLFIMTLVAIAATAMSTRLQLDIYRTHLSLIANRLYLASQYVTFWAMSELNYNKKPLIHPDAQGALLSFPLNQKLNYPEMTTTGHLFDLQSRFNLNNLRDKRYHRIFLNLLNNALPDVNQKDRSMIAKATLQWITPYEPGLGNDELVTYYLKQKPPYFQSGLLMQSPSEFRLIWGVDAKVFKQLEPYICVLPRVSPINLNTASKMVLKSLGNGLSDEQVQQIVEARTAKPLRRLDDIRNLLQKLAIRENTVTVESQYFVSAAVIVHEQLSLVNYAVLGRFVDKDQKVHVGLLSESFNTL